MVHPSVLSPTTTRWDTSTFYLRPGGEYAATAVIEIVYEVDLQRSDDQAV